MLILASASPRRQELLRNAGVAFEVEPASIDETPRAGEGARECAERLAQEKALAVCRRHSQNWVLGADTVVVVEGTILGKPNDGADAARMLRMLSGKTHEVITGVCLAGSASIAGTVSGKASTLSGEKHELRTSSETTLVTMVEISDEEIREYISTGEPMDKAGAYAIQGFAARWIPRIDGDYSNVVGLPVSLVLKMLREGKYGVT
jgi:nucleoside triphosphate pyrophosphatase